MSFKYLAFSGYTNFGTTDTLAESLRRYFTTGFSEVPELPNPAAYLLDHGLEGNQFDQMMLALRRRGGDRLEVSVKASPSGRTTYLNLSHCFTPACALQQAVCDLADGVSLDEARSKLIVDIRAWTAAVGHEVNYVEATEMARHVSKDIGQRYSAALMPIPSFFETKENKARETMAMMERKATSILDDTYRLIKGPWPGYRAGSNAQPRY